MLSIRAVLSKAYEYTRNHKQLWFFGFFITTGGFFSLIRLANWDPANFSARLGLAGAFLFQRYIFLGLGTLFVVAIFLILSSWAKSIMFSVFASAERNNGAFDLNKEIQQSRKYISRLLALNISAYALVLVIFAWIFAPVGYIMSQGYDMRGITLLILGVVILVPIFAIITLVNIYAQCFVVAFGLKFKKAISSALDLYLTHWAQSLRLLAVLSIAYAMVFFLSVSIVGTISGLAYLLSFLVKSISAPLFWILQSAAIAVFGIILIFANSILNVFTTSSWMIFFLRLVKANPISEEPRAVVEPNAAI